MPSKIDLLKRVLKGRRAMYKIPTESPANRAQRKPYDTFQKSASALYLQALAGGAERQERVRDYEQMDQSPEISSALNIYADDSVTYNYEGNIIKVKSEEENIVKTLEELYFDILDVDFNLWLWIRNMVKYGDMFALLDIEEKFGVLSAIPLPLLEMSREEGFDGNPKSTRFRWMTQSNQAFESYQIAHFRLLGDDRFLPYGRSILDPARRIWKQLILAEDAMLIYRMSRAPERLVFKIDVGNIPPKDVDSYMNNVRDKLLRTPLIDESTGNPDMRYNPMSILENYYLPMRGDRGSSIEQLPGGCLSLDTIIPLLDGRKETLKTLINEYNCGKKNWVYSCNPKTGSIVPGTISWAGITHNNAKVMKITLDNGQTITCTSDHKFPLWNKGKVEAKDLSIGDSIIPFYSRKEQLKDSYKEDYEQVFNNETKTWKFTHQLVASYFKDSLVKKIVYNEKNITENKFVVHHKDVNKFNNTPENLVYMGIQDHWEYHRNIYSKIGNDKQRWLRKNDQEWKEKNYKKRQETVTKYHQNLSEEEKTDIYTKVSNSLKEYYKNCSEEEKNNRKLTAVNGFKIANETRLKKLNSDTEYKRSLYEKMGKSQSITKRLKFSDKQHKIAINLYKNGMNKKEFVHMLLENDVFMNDLTRLNKDNGSPWKVGTFTFCNLDNFMKHFGYINWSGFIEAQKYRNHKIISIEYLDELQDVGTLTIDIEEKYHNYHTFALECGVFTFNSNQRRYRRHQLSSKQIVYIYWDTESLSSSRGKFSR